MIDQAEAPLGGSTSGIWLGPDIFDIIAGRGVEEVLMKFISYAAVAVSLTVSSPALAQLPSPDTAGQKQPEKAEKTVCKRLPTSGTRMAERVCLTREQWKKVDEEVRR